MSETCFVDTFALLAMLNPSDTRHREAMAWFDASHRPLVITEWVLTELADGLSAARPSPSSAACALIRARLSPNPPQIFSGEVWSCTRTAPTKTGPSPIASHLS